MYMHAVCVPLLSQFRLHILVLLKSKFVNIMVAFIFMLHVVLNMNDCMYSDAIIIHGKGVTIF